ncbi:MAG: membrane protein insertion efficiency factor YidD [Nitrosopumilus sp.]|nr:membrane protein insertion efficiency factor YidD [Nitrosopumilus sp.]
MKKITIITFLLINVLIISAQDKYEILSLQADHSHKHSYKYLTGHNDDEFDIAKNGLFLFYKNFLSSQDMDVCTFTPSCSEFAIQSIQTKGFLIGLFSAFDRLTRCNGLNPHKYPIDPVTHKYYDPVVAKIKK